MDVKDLQSETVLSERTNDGSKYASNAFPCNRTKPYQDMAQSPLGKVDVATARPCAVIGPDRVLPPPPSNDTKKGACEPWTDAVYRHPPEYPHKMSSYQTPIRNISPRQTFQENMQRIMVPPNYNTLKGNDESNFLVEKNIPLSKNMKSNIPPETKYCEVPYNLTNNDQKNIRNSELCVTNVNPVLTRPTPHGWPPQVRPQLRPFGASELYQYPEYANCAGPRPPPMPRPHRMIHDETGHVYPDPYSPDGSVRYKPYPIKERYPQARYEYITNYSNPYHPPPTFPPHKYDLQKPIHPPYSYPPVNIKYVDNRIVDPTMEGYQRQNPQTSYNLPFRNQMIHPAYGPVLGNCVQNKYPCPPDNSLKSVPPNKLPFDANKMYIDYENSRTKPFPVSESFYFNEIPRPHHAKNQVMANYPPVSMHGIPPYPYYRKENLTLKNYEYMQHYRNMDPGMPMSRIPSQFTPSSIAISPSDSNASNDITQIQNIQEDCGYVSQSPTASIRSMDSVINRSDLYRRYDSRYGPPVRMSMTSKPDQNCNSNANKDKKEIDVRQFLQMWSEVDDENGENSTKDAVNQMHPNEVNKIPNQYEVHKNQDQLYVLGLVDVPSEELGKYEHIQKVSKLPENIKGYNNIELLKQFEEVIESTKLNVHHLKPKPSISRDVGYRPIKGSMMSQPTGLVQRPVSPLDVEAKISQSVIHKEVGCNFEIKPCSPKMLNVEVATPVQNLLGERAIEKVANLHNVTPTILNRDDKNHYIKINHKDRKSNENTNISSCKLSNTSFTGNEVRENYSLQDLESNSGICLASLPRLDNDIELNFPEVNQQFINANKVDSVITKTKESPLNTEHSENVLLKLNEKDSCHGSEISYEFSSLVQETETEFSKLSRYRKKKVESGSTEVELPSALSHNIRTDSVIIKNPENSKTTELNKDVSTAVNKVPECLLSPGINVLCKNTEYDGNKHNIEAESISDVAIDFSLKGENTFSNLTTVTSPLNRLFCDDINQSKNTKDSLPELDNLCGMDLKANAIEKVNDTDSLEIKETDEKIKCTLPINSNIEPNPRDIKEIDKESPKLVKQLQTDINAHSTVIDTRRKEDLYQLTSNLSSNDKNIANVALFVEEKFDENKQHQDLPKLESNNLQSFGTIPILAKESPTSVDNNEIKDQTSNLNTNYRSDESETSSMDSESDSESSRSSSTSTSVQEDSDSDDDTIFDNNLEIKQENMIDSNSLNNCAKSKKLRKELLSPRIQNLITYSEGFIKSKAKFISTKPEGDLSKKGELLKLSDIYTNNEVMNPSINFLQITSSTDIELEKSIQNDETNIENHNTIDEYPRDISSETKMNTDSDNDTDLKNNLNTQSNKECAEILDEEDTFKMKINTKVDILKDIQDSFQNISNSETNIDNEKQDIAHVTSMYLENNAQNICNKNFEQEVISADISHDLLENAPSDNKIDIDKDTIENICMENIEEPNVTELSCGDSTQNNENATNVKYIEGNNEIICQNSKQNNENATNVKHIEGNDENICLNFSKQVKSTSNVFFDKAKDIPNNNNPCCSQNNVEDIPQETTNEQLTCELQENIQYINIQTELDNQNGDDKEINVSERDIDHSTNSLCVKTQTNSSEETIKTEKEQKSRNVNYADYTKNTNTELSISDKPDMEDSSLMKILRDDEKKGCNLYEDRSNDADINRQNDVSCDEKGKSSKIEYDNLKQEDITSGSIESGESSIANIIYDESVAEESEETFKKKENSGTTAFISEDVEELQFDNKKSIEVVETDTLLFGDTEKELKTTSNTELLEDDNSNNVQEVIYESKKINVQDISENIDNTISETFEEILERSTTPDDISTNIYNPQSPLDHKSPFKESLTKKRTNLKRSYSDSALDRFNNDSSDNSNLEWQTKRRKNTIRNVIPSHFIESNFCSIQNNRRNSISALYNEENVSFCILLDNNCIITEEDECEEQGKVCYAELSENYLSEIQESENEHETTDILLEQTNEYSEFESLEYIEQKSFEEEDNNQYFEEEASSLIEEKSFEESWVEDIACVETVVSEDITEDGDVTVSPPSTPKTIISPEEEEESEVFRNSEHANKVKYIYGDKMCNDDAQFLETLYRTPQMDVNKTLVNRESQISDESIQIYNNESLEKILSNSNSSDDLRVELDSVSSDSIDQCPSASVKLKNMEHDKENIETKQSTSVTEDSLFHNHEAVSEVECNKSERTQDQTVHSCESSTDNVFSYAQNDDYAKCTISSSPEVSSTTSEDRNSSILLKITNYKGSRISEIPNVVNETKKISCKFTEVNDYSSSLLHIKSSNRPLITKAAQKYIPPLKETIEDLKIRLPLPQQSLLKFRQLKLLKSEPKHKYSSTPKKEIPKKPKPKFEDVLKSIDEIQFQRHKESSKKTKKFVPKVVIKKNENGSHYASTTKRDNFNPDLTGRKWQPWVFLDKNHFIDKMALRNKKIAVYNHRKNTYVLAEKFRKYKSIGSAKFVISHPKLDSASLGQLKCTIRLKHS